MAMLGDAIGIMEAAVSLKHLSSEMRQHVRTRLGLILNEIGLLHNRRLENLMQTVDGGGADGLRARAEAQRRPMERAYKSAEAAFSKVGGCRVPAGSVECDIIWHDVAHNRMRGHSSGRDAAALRHGDEPGPPTAAVVGCANFAARMRLFRSGVGYRMALLHTGLPAGRGPRAGVELFRRALTLCDPTLLEPGDERRQVCFHAGEVLAMQADHQLEQARPPASEKRRTQLLGEALETYSQAATMYQEAGRPDRLLAMLHAQATVREGQALSCSHWFSRVKLVEEALSSAAAAGSPLAPLLARVAAGAAVSADATVAERAQDAAGRLFASLLNALKTVCLLLRKYGGNKKRQAPAYFEDLYRQSLAVSMRPGSELEKLAALVEQIRLAQKHS
ncbi:uncharacterized protein LOC119098985 [Pollicipes pollicipes]|uniref:uncharacterized protein LOC119098985 n=1 Tax=Pollicipes pollicipes TaxID=41117 RepID=UPI001885191F|nr:uncharacterized protein LOC119098985 [Pollicipes pollicipes]